jgi:hypothetical protein
MKRQSPTPVGVAGLSLGGALAAGLTCLEPGLAFSAPFIAHMDLGALVADAPVLGAMRADLADFGWKPRDFAAFAKRIGWNDLAPVIPTERIHLFAAEDDRFFRPEVVRRMWRRWGKPAIQWYPTSHMGFLPYIPDAVRRLRASRRPRAAARRSRGAAVLPQARGRVGSMRARLAGRMRRLVDRADARDAARPRTSGRPPTFGPMPGAKASPRGGATRGGSPVSSRQSAKTAGTVREQSAPRPPDEEHRRWSLSITAGAPWCRRARRAARECRRRCTRRRRRAAESWMVRSRGSRPARTRRRSRRGRARPRALDAQALGPAASAADRSAVGCAKAASGAASAWVRSAATSRPAAH